jgi:hypothetical protein
MVSPPTPSVRRGFCPLGNGCDIAVSTVGLFLGQLCPGTVSPNPVRNLPPEPTLRHRRTHLRGFPMGTTSLFACGPHRVRTCREVPSITAIYQTDFIALHFRRGGQGPGRESAPRCSDEAVRDRRAVGRGGRGARRTVAGRLSRPPRRVRSACFQADGRRTGRRDRRCPLVAQLTAAATALRAGNYKGRSIRYIGSMGSSVEPQGAR